MNKLTIVLVVYREQLQQLPLFPLLQQLTAEKNIFVVIYDNSPQPQANPLAADNVLYRHDPANPGLAAAYNFAWQTAQQQQADGLLLLDDDTQMTESYLKLLLMQDLTGLGAVVPRIAAGQRQISPVTADHYINRSSQPMSAGRTQQRLMAVNSGTLLPLPTLTAIGGFNREFPLDFLDHWLFWRLGQEQLPILILDTLLQHELSVLDYRQVSSQRYHSILQAENHYYQHYETTQKKAHRKQLLLRCCKQFLTVKNRQIWRMSWRALLNRDEAQL